MLLSPHVGTVHKLCQQCLGGLDPPFPPLFSDCQQLDEPLPPLSVIVSTWLTPPSLFVNDCQQMADPPLSAMSSFD